MTYTQPGRRKADVDDRDKNRCLKKLQNIGAPLDGWLCSQIDEREVLTTCELCGCANVRYLHEMFHPEYIGLMNVGCICAGILEGNELGAKKREIEARNRTQRRMRFILKHWVEKQPGIFNRRYHGYHYQIKCLNHQYAVFYRGKWCWKCKGQPMTSFSKAAGAIFHLIDPPVVTSR